MEEVERLVEEYKRLGYLRSKKVERAFRKVKREFFVPDELKEQAYVDAPLPIPGGVTISAPHMHVICLEELDLKRGEKFLEVGAGSGIFLAYAYEIIREKNKVFGIEINEETYNFALRNLERAGYVDKVNLILGDGSLGLAEEAPFDKILVSAAAPDFPKPLVEQLKVGGCIVAIIGYHEQYLVKGIKKDEKEIEKKVVLPVVFLPLRGEYGWSNPKIKF
ncbi:MAG: protein-L-isoaspartate(D-aspartate) O-methyltransferase [Candidatus Aenigmarchaeota archaeon]|jgi:protein-L-isoaspartate(D-aspartate) O-methyltransferase|nr:protein-L-isoaspartate(D-aspartate) O-methyltransferase [Candidatus Aenigmarchaeota archaeon]